MGIGVKVKVWGEYALFSRPEMKVERCSDYAFCSKRNIGSNLLASGNEVGD